MMVESSICEIYILSFGELWPWKKDWPRSRLAWKCQTRGRTISASSWSLDLSIFILSEEAAPKEIDWLCLNAPLGKNCAWNQSPSERAPGPACLSLG
jgi:hypothetical protein